MKNLITQVCITCFAQNVNRDQNSDPSHKYIFFKSYSFNSLICWSWTCFAKFKHGENSILIRKI